jgi:hypothetical protein
MKQDAPSKPEQKQPAKQAYSTPSLIEYGSIAKLTQTGGVTGADAMAMMACL